MLSASIVKTFEDYGAMDHTTVVVSTASDLALLLNISNLLRLKHLVRRAGKRERCTGSIRCTLV